MCPSLREEQLPHLFFPLVGIPIIVFRALVLLDQNPDILKKYRNMCPPKYENYGKAIVLETLRLFPIVDLHSRLCLKDDATLGLKAGEETITFHRYVNRLVPHGDEFMPERFIDKDTHQLTSYYETQLLMFSNGPRVCKGKDLVLVLSEYLLQKMSRCEYTYKLKKGTFKNDFNNWYDFVLERVRA